jgi:hypothetical protein
MEKSDKSTIKSNHLCSISMVILFVNSITRIKTNFQKKNAEDIISLTCRLSNDVGSSEISFSLKELLFILLSQDVEVTTILDYGTTESQGNDIYIKKKEEFEDTKGVVEIKYHYIDTGSLESNIPSKSGGLADEN